MSPEEKILPLGSLSEACSARRAEGKTVVLTSGCFDLLHGGHLHYICDAGELGFLVVGINSDQFVKRLKGENRPIRDQSDRAFLMAGFYPVQLVTIFDDDYELIRAVVPHIYVASVTSHVRVWEDTQRIALLEELGSQVIEIESKKQDSTTDIIRRSAR